MNIYQRINEVRKSIGYVQKDKSVSTGSGSYKAVTHDQVTGMVRKALIDNGVIVVADTKESVFHAKETDAKQRLYEATYVIHFVNMDQPEERISMTMNAHALDNGDKAPGKALSYATKYAILKLFNIETGEDEESRYQQEDFDIQFFTDAIKAAGTMEDLKTVYGMAFDAAKKTNDPSIIKIIARIKDERKSELSS